MLLVDDGARYSAPRVLEQLSHREPLQPLLILRAAAPSATAAAIRPTTRCLRDHVTNCNGMVAGKQLVNV
jgi:hypothetical protein